MICFFFNILLPVPDVCEKEFFLNVSKVKEITEKKEENGTVEINIHRSERTSGLSLSQRVLVKSD